MSLEINYASSFLSRLAFYLFGLSIFLAIFHVFPWYFPFIFLILFFSTGEREDTEDITYYLPELTGENYEVLHDALGRLSGVQSPGIDTPTKTVDISYNEKFIKVEKIFQAIKDAGFTPVQTAKKTKEERRAARSA